MAKRFAGLEPEHRDFIAAQPLFYVATAAPTGRINLSPKGMDSLRAVGPNRILWLNATGSGNETAAHLAEDPRMTLMWCSFDARPLILRAYGRARCVYRGGPDWNGLAPLLPEVSGARQIFDLDVDLVQSSCGYAVPLMAFEGPRDTLRAWAGRKSPAELEAYWAERNAQSLDGRPTGIDAAAATPR